MKTPHLSQKHKMCQKHKQAFLNFLKTFSVQTVITEVEANMLRVSDVRARRTDLRSNTVNYRNSIDV